VGRLAALPRPLPRPRRQHLPPQAAAGGRVRGAGGERRAPSHSLVALPLIHFAPDRLTHLVPLFQKRHCGRTPGERREVDGDGRRRDLLPAAGRRRAARRLRRGLGREAGADDGPSPAPGVGGIDGVKF
jgi:hypothetical protein